MLVVSLGHRFFFLVRKIAKWSDMLVLIVPARLTCDMSEKTWSMILYERGSDISNPCFGSNELFQES